jgi:hypothetical protein
LGRIIPTDELIFFRGVEISPKHILFSPIVGMMIQSDFHIFQGGWNHQLAMYRWFSKWNLLLVRARRGGTQRRSFLQYVSLGSVEACHYENGWRSFPTLGGWWYIVCEFWLQLVQQVPTAMGVYIPGEQLGKLTDVECRNLCRRQKNPMKNNEEDIHQTFINDSELLVD